MRDAGVFIYGYWWCRRLKHYCVEMDTGDIFAGVPKLSMPHVLPYALGHLLLFRDDDGDIFASKLPRCCDDVDVDTPKLLWPGWWWRWDYRAIFGIEWGTTGAILLSVTSRSRNDARRVSRRLIIVAKSWAPMGMRRRRAAAATISWILAAALTSHWYCRAVFKDA